MRLLLDTHVVFWWLSEPEKLSAPARTAIESAESVFVSAVSSWEIATKVRIGKWPTASQLVETLVEVMGDEGFEPLAISHAHARRAGLLISKHRDPFDRVLAAQSDLENLTLVTADDALQALCSRHLW